MSALEKIMELAPKAVEEAERILNRSTSMNARIQMIEIVLNRAFGKPEAALRIETGGRSIAESAAALQAEIRAVMGADQTNVMESTEDETDDDCIDRKLFRHSDNEYSTESMGENQAQRGWREPRCRMKMNPKEPSL